MSRQYLFSWSPKNSTEFVDERDLLKRIYIEINQNKREELCLIALDYFSYALKEFSFTEVLTKEVTIEDIEESYMDYLDTLFRKKKFDKYILECKDICGND